MSHAAGNLARRRTGRQASCSIRRTFAKLLSASALTGGFSAVSSSRVKAQSAPAATPVARGTYLIKNGAVITVDPAQGVLPRADVLVRAGSIEAIGSDLAAAGAETIDATDMIVMPGFVDTHYHMWSALGRNFIGDGGFGYFPAKNATSTLYQPDDFYNSVMLGLAELANAGITTVHNWSHNTRTPAHADAELRAHRESMLRARYAYGHIDRMPRNQVLDFTDIDRVRREYFAGGSAFEGLVTFGVNLRGLSQSDEAAYHADMKASLERGLPVADSRQPGASQRRRRGGLRAARLARPQSAHLPLHSGPRHRCRDHGTDEDAAELCDAFGVSLRCGWRCARRSPTHAQGWRPDLAVLRRHLDRAAQHVRDDAVHLEHGNPLAGHPVGGPVPGGIPRGHRNGDHQRCEGAGSRRRHRLAHRWQTRRHHLIRANDINVAPMANIETTVVQSATPANVDTVLVDGRIVKRQGKLVAYDVEKIVREAKASSLRIRTAAGGVLTPR